MSSNKIRTGIGLALIGCGDIGKARAQFARMYPAVEWIGVCDVNIELAKLLAEEIHADFVTNDVSELLSRSELDAVIIATMRQRILSQFHLLLKEIYHCSLKSLWQLSSNNQKKY